MSKLRYSDITPKDVFMNRRQIMAGAVGLGLAPLLGTSAMAAKLNARKSKYRVDADITPKDSATTYNNFYEFGRRKEDPARNAHQLTIDPWTVEIGGLVDKPGNYSYDDIIKMGSLEERVYRFRCVEGWSMVVPWIGFSLANLLKNVGPQSGAKYVAFETLYRPEEMPDQKGRSFPYPYVEGLRMDEAMHPLTMLSNGMYGEELPKQNGAPLRLVVPWKYGFKSIKSIVKITLTSKQPPATWNILQPSEYGFYSNVNPEVDHPRWSQATERPLGGGVFAKRIPTLMFNGYEAEVASLYKGMDLRKFF